MALVLAASAISGGGSGTSPEADREQAIAAQILVSAGWRAALVTADTPLAAAWQELHRFPGSAGRADQPPASAGQPVMCPAQ